jgi:hypothetical protein
MSRLLVYLACVIGFAALSAHVYDTVFPGPPDPAGFDERLEIADAFLASKQSSLERTPDKRAVAFSENFLRILEEKNPGPMSQHRGKVEALLQDWIQAMKQLGMDEVKRLMAVHFSRKIFW